ncbi:hypothetical protein C2G38_2004400, partial [Gigaspora rosea]
MIMWEISSGRIVFSEYKDSPMNICVGFKPTVIKGTGKCYVELLESCWNDNPEKRPSASKIYETI